MGLDMWVQPMRRGIVALFTRLTLKAKNISNTIEILMKEVRRMEIWT